MGTLGISLLNWLSSRWHRQADPARCHAKEEGPPMCKRPLQIALRPARAQQTGSGFEPGTLGGQIFRGGTATTAVVCTIDPDLPVIV